jgi:hypothetical protein
VSYSFIDDKVCQLLKKISNFFLSVCWTSPPVKLTAKNICLKNCWKWCWSYSKWIYNYLCNQCPSPLKLWVRIPLRRGVLDSTLCDKVCQWFATDRWFSPGTGFPHQYNWMPRYNWNIVESGVKYLNPNHNPEMRFSNVKICCVLTHDNINCVTLYIYIIRLSDLLTHCCDVVNIIYYICSFKAAVLDRDRMVVGFTTTCAISTYHH